MECPRRDMPVEKRDTGQRGEHMGRGKYQPEQVVNLLRQIEVAVANRKTTPPGMQGCRDRGADLLPLAQEEYGGLQVDQAKRLKELEQENSKLKRLVANP